MKQLLLSCIFLISSCLVWSQSPLVYTGDFENNSLSPFGTQSAGKSYSVSISKNFAFNGTHAARIELRKSDNFLRSELFINPDSKSVSQSEWWYGWATYLPFDYSFNSKEDKIFEQLHSNLPYDANPPQALVLRKTDFIMQVSYQTLVATSANMQYPTNKGSNPKSFEVNLTKLFGVKPQVGAWNTFTLHEIFDYNVGGKGLTQLWVNNSDPNNPTYTYKGPNCYNEAHGLYFKTGCYEWNIANDTSKLGSNTILYVDAIKIGNSTASFNDVSPVASTVPPTPVTQVPTKIVTTYIYKNAQGNVITTLNTAKTVEATTTVYDQNGIIINSSVSINTLPTL